MGSLVSQLYEILVRPGDAWLEIKEEPATPGQLYLRYALPLGAIPPVARMIGMTVVGLSFLGTRYRSPLLPALGYGVASYVLSLLALYGAAFFTDMFAPYAGGRKNRIQALKLVTCSSIPYWLGGVFLCIPGLSPLSTLSSLYGYYLLYRGLPIMMETPKEKVLPYFLVLLGVTVILGFAVGSIATTLFLEGPIGQAKGV